MEQEVLKNHIILFYGLNIHPTNSDANKLRYYISKSINLGFDKESLLINEILHNTSVVINSLRESTLFNLLLYDEASNTSSNYYRISKVNSNIKVVMKEFIEYCNEKNIIIGYKDSIVMIAENGEIVLKNPPTPVSKMNIGGRVKISGTLTDANALPKDNIVEGNGIANESGVGKETKLDSNKLNGEI